MKRRRVQAPITSLENDPRESVCLRVAAEYLGLDERTVRARIACGKLRAWRDGAWCIPLTALREYDEARRSVPQCSM